MRTQGIAATVLIALAATGCSAEIEPKDTAAEDQSSTSAPNTSSTTGSTATESADSSTADSPPAASMGDPVATRTSGDAGAKLELSVYPITRSGELAVLNFTVSLPASAEDSYNLSDVFGDSNGDAGDASSWTVDGVQLTDPANGKLYLVASDGNGNCVCSNLLGQAITPGDTRTFTATYAAPPTDVTSVNVSFPIFGTVTDVPVQ